MTSLHRDLTRQVLDRCGELRFALAGIAPPARTQYEAELRAWLDARMHGEMAYMADHLPLRIDPAQLLPGVRAIICVADRYAHGGTDPRSAAGEPPRGRIARYARGDDYHKIIKKRLHTLCDDLAARYPDAQFKACVDTAPVLEREHAARAGLGAVGKHTLLIQRGAGSYLLLGEVLTTLPLEPSSPAPGDPCGTCTRCMDACPTDAITPWSVDATKCISYLTIEHRGLIDEALHEPMRDWIFGCDICQEVCPHNQPTRRKHRDAAAVHEAYTPRHDSFDLLEVLNWTEDDRRAAFVRSAMKRAKLPMMKRNALIAAGNALRAAPDDALRRRIEAIAADATEDDLVRDTAGSVLARLNRQAAAASD